jgi:hypothetical protein
LKFLKKCHSDQDQRICEKRAGTELAAFYGAKRLDCADLSALFGRAQQRR